MVAPSALDCAPLHAPVRVAVSDADLRRVEPLQRALLSPLDHDTVDDWRRGVNRAAVRAFGSDSAMFQLDVDGVGLQFSAEFDASVLATYVNEVMPELARMKRIYRRLAEVGAGNRSILWQGDLEWLYGSEYFHGMLVGLRAYDPLWVGVAVEGRRYPACLQTYHDRRCRDRYFGATDVRLMMLLRPALRAGVETVLRVVERRSAVAASLDRIRDGAMAYVREGRLVHRNPALASVARTRRDDARLLEAGAEMARGLLHDGDGMPAIGAADATRWVTTRGGVYRLSAVRMCSGVFDIGPAVLVTVAAGRPRLPTRAQVRERHGLTRRQAEVALLLARRKTNAEIAEMLCISPHTAHHHTDAVLSKLGAENRRDVERRLRDQGRAPGRAAAHGVK